MNNDTTKGFTIIELMITVAVLAVLVTIAVPGMQTLIQNNRRVAAINDMVTVLHLARSEAIKRGIAVTICPSTNGEDCSGETEWEDGWLVFANNEGDADVVDGGDEILKYQDGFTAASSLRGSGALASLLTFSSKGYPSGLGMFTYCDTRGETEARAVEVSYSGRLVLKHADDGLDCP